MEKGIQTPMAQGRPTKIISMMKWIRTSRLSRKNTLSATPQAHHALSPPEYSRAYLYPWSPFPPRRARPGPGPHMAWLPRYCSVTTSVGWYGRAWHDLPPPTQTTDIYCQKRHGGFYHHTRWLDCRAATTGYEPLIESERGRHMLGSTRQPTEVPRS